MNFYYFHYATSFLLFLKAQVLKITNYTIAPFLYHSSLDSLVSSLCVSLFEFVDAYTTFIIAIIFIISLVLSKNHIFSVISFSKTIPSQGVLSQSANRSILSLPTLLNTSLLKLIKYQF